MGTGSLVKEDIDRPSSEATHLPLWMARLPLVWVLDFLGRKATGPSLNASSEPRYESSVTAVFVPCSLDLDSSEPLAACRWRIPSRLSLPSESRPLPFLQGQSSCIHILAAC